MTRLTLMNPRTIFCIVLCVVSSFTAKAQQCPALVWSDEFDQASLNMTDWSFQTGGGGYGNNELQNYTSRSQNLSLVDGKLVITALKEDYNGDHYTSAKIWTNGKRSFTYGRMEAKMKLPKTQGLWPAFWMMPQASFYGGWPRSGEIDIMEMKGSDVYTTYGTIHYGSDPTTDHRYKGGSYSGIDDLSNDFHVYAVEWKVDTISWYIDDVNFYTVTKTDIGAAAWPFDKDFYLIFNLAVGGFFGGDPNGSSVFPQTMEVDYVRVYSNPNTLHITGTTKAIAGQTYEYKITNGTADSYNWSVPSGATIVNGQGTNTINVTWGTTSGDVTVDVVRGTCGASTFYKAVHVIPNGCDVYFDDFETNTLLSYSTSSTGVQYNPTEPNPAANTINSSSNVALYKRNVSEQYDVLKYDVNFLPTSVDYENGNNVLYMDMYTAAPAGTVINWQFENKARVSQAYPVGRRAVFQGTTTVQNQWERIKFTLLNRPDLNTSPTTIDQFTILFRPNTNTSDTYYIDNLMRRDVLNCGLVTSVEHALEKNFIISPNPAHDRMDIAMNAMPTGKVDIVVTDVLGAERMKSSSQITSTSQIESVDISALSPGLYIVYVRQDGATLVSRKVIVQ
jgi:beta-glucanase (GH16 family)